MSWVTPAAFFCFFFFFFFLTPVVLITSEAGEGLRPAWPNQLIAWLSVLGWGSPTAAGILHELCYSLIALHSTCKLMLNLFLMGVKE